MPFLLTGAILGFALGGGWALIPQQLEQGTLAAQRMAQLSDGAVVGYLGLFGAAIGTLLGAIGYVLVDRRS